LDQTLALSKTACDIHLKHVFLPKFGLGIAPAPKLCQISFRFFGYHNVARTVVILNNLQFGDIWFSSDITEHITTHSTQLKYQYLVAHKIF